MRKIINILFAFIFSLVVSNSFADEIVVDNSQHSLAQSQQELIDLFFAAARSGQNEVIQEFLKNGFPVDVKNEKGFTALMMAAYYGHQDVVTTLLDSGANRCLRDSKGHTALMGAIVKAEWSIAKQLRQVDCDVQGKQNGQLTTEQFAEIFGQKNKLKELIQ